MSGKSYGVNRIGIRTELADLLNTAVGFGLIDASELVEMVFLDATEGELADEVLRLAWEDRRSITVHHKMVSIRWQTWFDTLSEVERMLHDSDQDDDDKVRPTTYLAKGCASRTVLEL